MDSFFEFINGLSQWQIIISLWSIVFFTSIGIFPNQNNLFLALILSNLKSISQSFLSVVIIFYTAIYAGDLFTYLLGRKFGPKILNFKFIKNKISQNTVLKLKDLLNTNTFKALFLHRITPFFRPQILLIFSAFGIKINKFLKNYTLIFTVFFMIEVSLFYFTNSVVTTYFENFKTLNIFLTVGLWISVIAYVKKKLFSNIKL